MKYRIKEHDLGNGWYRVYIQCKSRWRWRTIWCKPFVAEDRDYVLMCADELKEHLETGI